MNGGPPKMVEVEDDGLVFDARSMTYKVRDGVADKQP
jgi:hypothetical protein